MEKKIIKPSVKFINELAELTENNDHTECYRRVAIWGRTNAPTADGATWFDMFANMFMAMQTAHESVDNFPFGDMRYEVGKAMDDLIVREFGPATLDELNKGR